MTKNPQKKKNLLKNNKIIIVAILALLILGGVFLVLKLLDNSIQRDEPVSDNKPDSSVRELTPMEKASEASQNGDYAAGQKIIDEEFIDKAGDDKDKKSDAYVEKAIFALNNGYNDEAAKYAEEANNFKSDRKTLRLLAQVAEKAGDNAKAASYYQAVLDSYTADELKDDTILLQQYNDQEALGRVR